MYPSLTNPNWFILEETSELPNFVGCDELFLDVETENNTADKIDKKHAGMYPFLGDRIAGIAASTNDDPHIYYIPIRHSGNLHDANKNLDTTIYPVFSPSHGIG